MSKPKSFKMVAGEAIPFGFRVRIDRHDPKKPVCRRSVKDSTMDGVARRVWGGGDRCHYEPGEIVDVQTSGGILIQEEDGNTKFVTLRAGKVVD